jgi:cardiolipin synthase
MNSPSTPEAPAVTEPLPQTAHDLGHDFRWLHSGTDAYDTIVAMIDGARQSVAVEFYTIEPCAPADSIQAALLRARSRGVPVRVLIDAFGSSALPEAWGQKLTAAGGEVRRFNPRPLLRLSFRDHRKLVVCDARVAFVGGFNVTEAFVDDGIARGWRDLGLRIEGPLATDLERGFDALWASSGLDRRSVRPLARFLRGQRIRSGAASTIVGAPGAASRLLKRCLQDDMRSATRVDIAAAYFLPSRSLRRGLRQVARRGPVRVLLSGNSDVPVARRASEHMYRGLLRDGVALWEYQPQVMHAKALVVDDVVYVGSANLDTRSLQLNFELMVRLPSPLLAAQVRARIDHDCTLAGRVPEDWARHRTWWQRLTQRWAHFLLARVDPFVARAQFRHLR